MYRISDFFYLILRLIKYRNKVIIENLQNSFPNNNNEENINIRNQFYRHLCDLFVETLKLMSVSAKTIQKRVQIENIEYLNNAFGQNRDVIAVIGHYNNWEWIPVINYQLKALGCAAYHPLKDQTMDKVILKLRSLFNSYNIPLKSTNRRILKLKKEGTRYVLGLISDQSPGFISIQYKMKFLNQTTPVLLGAEKLAKLTNDIVVFFEMHKVRRGYYKLKVVPLFENPKETKQYEITKTHVKHLEKLIIEKPQYWLWSHRRWKFSTITKEEFERQNLNAN